MKDTSAEIFMIILNPATPRSGTGAALRAAQLGEVVLPPEYAEYADVFSEENAATLPATTKVKHSIVLKEGSQVPYKSIYPLSAHELNVLREYIDSSLTKG